MATTTLQSLVPTFSVSKKSTLFRDNSNNNIVTFNNNRNKQNNFVCGSFNKLRKFTLFSRKPLPHTFSGAPSVVQVAVPNDGSTVKHCGGPCGSVMMSGSFGSSSAVTLQKPKPELAQKTRKISLEEKLEFDDTSGGGNGNNKIGGGDNGGGGFGDDDDYFGDFDDDDDDGDQGGWFRRRIALTELYDSVFIESVLNEWQKTLTDLPDGIRIACELGAISSAQLVQYLMNEARPTITRAISRTFSKSMSRAFMGRITADPAFLHKLLFEQFVTVTSSLHSEFERRGERMKQEWDLAFTNVVTASACNLAVVWSLAPCCSFGNTARFNLQNTLRKLPNNIFEASYRHKKFGIQQRIQSFVYKAVQLSLVGFTAGAVQTALSNLCARNKEGRPSVQIPPANTNALGYGAFVGLYTNLRYQMLCGMDKALTRHFDVIGVSLFFTTAFRILNAQLGEISRTSWLDPENFALLPQKTLNDKVTRKRRIITKNWTENPILA